MYKVFKAYNKDVEEIKMTQKEIEEVLKRNYEGCEAEESWNACSELDETGFIDVAICFKATQEIKELLGDLILDDPLETCWLWALAASKGYDSNQYSLAGMESSPRIDKRTKLSRAIRYLYDKEIRKAKQEITEG